MWFFILLIFVQRGWTFLYCGWIIVLFLDYLLGIHVEWYHFCFWVHLSRIVSTGIVIYVLWMTQFLKKNIFMTIMIFTVVPVIVYFTVPPTVIVLVATVSTMTLSVLLPNLSVWLSLFLFMFPVQNAWCDSSYLVCFASITMDNIPTCWIKTSFLYFYFRNCSFYRRYPFYSRIISVNFYYGSMMKFFNW